MSEFNFPVLGWVGHDLHLGGYGSTALSQDMLGIRCVFHQGVLKMRRYLEIQTEPSGVAAYISAVILCPHENVCLVADDHPYHCVSGRNGLRFQRLVDRGPVVSGECLGGTEWDCEPGWRLQLGTRFLPSVTQSVKPCNVSGNRTET